MHNAMDDMQYDSKEGIGKVESGTETESNAGAVFPVGKASASSATAPALHYLLYPYSRAHAHEATWMW